MKQGSFNGYSLIELMIIVAIIATLVSIAIPSYSSYATRAKVSEVLSVSSLAKLAVMESWTSEGDFSTASDIFNFNSDNHKIIADIIIDDVTGRITITTEKTGALVDPVLLLVPEALTNSVNWTCALLSGESNHVPPQCRNVFET